MVFSISPKETPALNNRDSCVDNLNQEFFGLYFVPLDNDVRESFSKTSKSTT